MSLRSKPRVYPMYRGEWHNDQGPSVTADQLIVGADGKPLDSKVKATQTFLDHDEIIKRRKADTDDETFHVFTDFRGESYDSWAVVAPSGSPLRVARRIAAHLPKREAHDLARFFTAWSCIGSDTHPNRVLRDLQYQFDLPLGPEAVGQLTREHIERIARWPNDNYDWLSSIKDLRHAPYMPSKEVVAHAAHLRESYILIGQYDDSRVSNLWNAQDLAEVLRKKFQPLTRGDFNRERDAIKPFFKELHRVGMAKPCQEVLELADEYLDTLTFTGVVELALSVVAGRLDSWTHGR